MPRHPPVLPSPPVATTETLPARAARRLRAALASRRTRAILKVAVGVALLAAVAAQTGAEPFIRGLASITPAAVVAALVLAAIATAAAAWRWRLVASGYGVPLGQGQAVAAYYRSQFLNTVLPGGVVGDVHRAVAHGTRVLRVGDASRAVAAERAAGQTVQFVLTLGVLVSIGVSAYARAVGVLMLGILVACAVVAVAAVLSARARRIVLRELARLRAAFAPRRTVVQVIAASAVVVACHVATFVVAAVAVGVQASPPRLVAVAVVAVLAASIPFNVGGWGPRETAAGWAFGAVGLGATTGIAASTAFGVLAMIAVAPGAAVVAASALRRRREAGVVAAGGAASVPAVPSAPSTSAVPVSLAGPVALADPVSLAAEEERTT
ncbi:lysylphosphatidylglycerol synthase domain-containing protein [Microbacterium sp. SS28]|uniref:lysylphosphatidylglycerol synthase domain-containing protein n=1 Tax=Microbacterium sp. SS28 TaxID=2919948 RepID=UPI001FA9FF05|nr:lysylphosphatidylglycerol synthase domain-containing protein [Microbacterium sp. SS28]